MQTDLKARMVAVELLEQVLGGRQPLDQQLRFINDSGLPDRDRAFARHLVMVCLRRLHEVDAILASRMERPLPDAQRLVQHILRIGVVQLLWLDTPPHAAIDTAVRLVKYKKMEKQSGLVNAVLRRISEQKATLINQPPVLHALALGWQKTYGEQVTAAIMQAHLQEPPLDIFVRENAPEWATKLEGELLYGQTVRRANGAVPALEGYQQGAWWVQDVAASLPVTMLGDVAGKSVLDLCAAPGGKTAQLIAAGADVTALDRSTPRLKQLRENMRRLKMKAHIVTADVMHWQPEKTYDAILLDAPCSATGTIRRHPDIVHLRTASEITKVCELQAAMLDRVAGWMKPGMKLVYGVCSLERAEGEAQIEALLARHPELRLVPATGFPDAWVTPEGYLRTLPHYLAEQGGMDGFFAACLEVA